MILPLSLLRFPLLFSHTPSSLSTTLVRLSIIIPAFNEEARLPRTLESIRAYFAATGEPHLELGEILVIDDGSGDATSAVVEHWRESLPIRAIRLTRNRGKGASCRRGVSEAAGDLILLYDADGATPIEEVPRLAELLREGRADIAIGSRVRGHSADVVMSFHRRLIGRIYHALCSGLCPGIEDAACGCKLFTAPVAKRIFSVQRINRFAFDVEILSLAQRYRYRIAEVPVHWTAVPGSKVNLVMDSVQMTLSVLGLYWRRLWRRS